MDIEVLGPGSQILISKSQILASGSWVPGLGSLVLGPYFKLYLILSASIMSIAMIDLRRKLLVMYVIKRIMKFKYKNRKMRALFLRMNSIKAYLQGKKVFASMIRSMLFEMNIRRRRSVWAYQREELWFYSMLKDQNLEQHWTNDFRMSQNTFLRYSESCSTSIGRERYSVLTCNPY